eukprot:Rhum_TRINITY_DN15333_c13_g1::Rhum_TRINITY_DN15333_c13_g1_i1::g.152460::m.152460
MGGGGHKAANKKSKPKKKERERERKRVWRKGNQGMAFSSKHQSYSIFCLCFFCCLVNRATPSKLGRALHPTDDGLGSVLVDVRLRVHHLELLCGILAGVQHDGVLATRVLRQEVRHVQHPLVHNAPAVLLGRVLRHLLHRVLLRARRGGGGGGGLLRVRLAVEVVLRVTRDLAAGGGGSRGARGRGGGGRSVVEAHRHALRVRVHHQVHRGACAGAGSATASRHLVHQVRRRAGAADAAVHDAVEQRRSAEAVAAVDASGDLATAEQARHRLALGVEHLGVGVALDAAEGVVDHGGDDARVEDVVRLPRHVHEELPAERVLLGLGVLVEGAKALGQLGLADAHVLRQLGAAGVLPHEAAALVVQAVPLDRLGGGTVQDQAVRPVVVRPHLARHVVTLLQLVDKAVAVLVQEDATGAAQRLRGKELRLVVRLLRVHERRRVHLHHVEVDRRAAHSRRHLDAVTGAVHAVGGRKVHVLGAERLQETRLAEVRAVSARRQHDGAVRCVRHAVLLVLHAAHLARDGHELRRARLRHDLHALRGGGHDLLQLLEQGVRDRHAGELLLAAVRARERVSAQTAHKRQVQPEALDQPLDRRRRVEHQTGVRGEVGVHGGVEGVLALHGGLLGGGLLGRGTLDGALGGVLQEGVDAVVDAEALLRAREGAVDARRRLRRVSTAEAELLEQQHAAAALEDGVARGQARKASADDDNLAHCDKGFSLCLGFV